MVVSKNRDLGNTVRVSSTCHHDTRMLTHSRGLHVEVRSYKTGLGLNNVNHAQG